MNQNSHSVCLTVPASFKADPDETSCWLALSIKPSRFSIYRVIHNNFFIFLMNELVRFYLKIYEKTMRRIKAVETVDKF